MNGEADQTSEPTGHSRPPLEREDDAIYQEDKLVARVADPEVNWEARTIHFGEISNSDYLLLSEECEFRKYRIMVQRIAFASRIEKDAPEKGRVLRDVIAEILGYREQ